jgi:hypothetical protein
MAIEKYKGQDLSLGLVQLLDFGADKVRYNSGRYAGKGGETEFLRDMLSLYEDYHPCPSGTADDKELVKYHKGINQNVYRACMLGGNAFLQYRAFAGKESKAKGISQALRTGYDAMIKALAANKPLDEARGEGEIEYCHAMNTYTPKSGEKETAKDLQDQRDKRAKNLMSIMACEAIDKGIKAIIGKTFETIDNGDVEGFAKWLEVHVKDKITIIE